MLNRVQHRESGNHLWFGGYTWREEEEHVFAPRGPAPDDFASHDYKTTNRPKSSTTNRYVSVKCCSQMANDCRTGRFPRFRIRPVSRSQVLEQKLNRPHRRVLAVVRITHQVRLELHPQLARLPSDDFHVLRVMENVVAVLGFAARQAA